MQLGKDRPPISVGSCNIFNLCLGFLPCHINLETAFSSSRLTFLVRYRGSICKGYRSRGSTFILMRLIRPNNDRGRLCHRSKSPFTASQTGEKLNFHNSLKAGDILTPRYINPEADNVKGKSIETSVLFKHPSGMASDLLKLIL